jgi:hypothetical protein
VNLTTAKVHLPVTASAVPDQTLKRHGDCYTLHTWQPPITVSTSTRHQHPQSRRWATAGPQSRASSNRLGSFRFGQFHRHWQRTELRPTHSPPSPVGPSQRGPFWRRIGPGGASMPRGTKLRRTVPAPYPSLDGVGALDGATTSVSPCPASVPNQAPSHSQRPPASTSQATSQDICAGQNGSDSRLRQHC